MDKWQPIETAPKDGSIVTTGRKSWAEWMDPLYPLSSKFDGGKWLTDFGDKVGWAPFDPQPTHWLPSPPVSGGE